MNDAALNDRLFLAFSIALGLIVAGAGNALFGPRNPWLRIVIAGLGYAVAVGCSFSLIPESVGLVAAIGAGLLLLASLVHFASIRRSVAGIWNRLQSPRIAWTAVALVGLGAMAFEMIRFDAQQEAGFLKEEAWLKEQVEVNPYVTDETRVAKTDRGSSIHMMSVGEAQSVESLTSREQQTLLTTQLAEYVIRRAPADDSSNCHGWVFAGGKFAITGSEVDTILAENEYEAVPMPHPGDICIYRNGANGVAHTAIVRTVLEDGTVLVESKWGRLGVFLHPVERSCYGTNFTYYRSDRGTHVLRSIPGSSN